MVDSPSCLKDMDSSILTDTLQETSLKGVEDLLLMALVKSNCRGYFEQAKTKEPARKM